MTTNTQTVPTFPPCQPWCPGHNGNRDISRRIIDGRWTKSCSAASTYSAITGGDGEYVAVYWGATTVLDVGIEYGITLDTGSQQDMTVEDARQLASYLLAAANAMEAAQR